MDPMIMTYIALAGLAIAFCTVAWVGLEDTDAEAQGDRR